MYKWLKVTIKAVGFGSGYGAVYRNQAFKYYLGCPVKGIEFSHAKNKSYLEFSSLLEKYMGEGDIFPRLDAALCTDHVSPDVKTVEKVLAQAVEEFYKEEPQVKIEYLSVDKVCVQVSVFQTQFRWSFELLEEEPD